MANQLKYEITTNPSPLYYTRDTLNPSITNIIIAITPEEEEDIVCSALQFSIALGPDASDLTTVNNEASIVPESLQSTWAIERFSAGIYRAFPLTPDQIIKAGEVIVFQLQGIVVNEAAGATLMNIVATLSEESQNTNIVLNKVRSNLDIVDFSGNPPAIYPEEFCTLSWTTVAASTVVLLPDAPPSLPTNGSYKVSPTVPTTYYLIAYGEGPAVTKTFPVQVTRAQIIEFTSSDNSIIPGQAVALRWIVQDAASIEISPGDHKDLPPTGTLVVMPTQTTAYSLKATNVNSEDQQDLVVVVNVPSPEILSFDADPPSFYALDPVPVELSWRIENAKIVSLSPGTYGPLNLVDSVTVNPMQTTTYTLTASNDGLIDVRQLTVQETYTKEFDYYNASDVLAWIDLLCFNLPIGSAVALHATPQFLQPDSRINIPKTTVDTYPEFKASTFSGLVGDTTYTFFFTYYPEGQPTPPDGYFRLEIVTYNSEAAQLVDGKIVLKSISGDNYPEESYTKVFSKEFKIPSG